MEDGKTAEVMVGMRGGMGKKNRKNPWITPSQSLGSEPEMVGTETGGSWVEERDDEKLQEVLERKVRLWRKGVFWISWWFGGDGRGREGKDDADV